MRAVPATMSRWAAAPQRLTDSLDLYFDVAVRPAAERAHIGGPVVHANVNHIITRVRDGHFHHPLSLRVDLPCRRRERDAPSASILACGIGHSQRFPV